MGIVVSTCPFFLCGARSVVSTESGVRWSEICTVADGLGVFSGVETGAIFVSLRELVSKLLLPKNGESVCLADADIAVVIALARIIGVTMDTKKVRLVMVSLRVFSGTPREPRVRHSKGVWYVPLCHRHPAKVLAAFDIDHRDNRALCQQRISTMECQIVASNRLGYD